MQHLESEGESFTEKFVSPSLKVGALGGTLGFLLGTITGTLRSKTPFLFATASGIQCFCIGTTFWSSRTALIHAKTFHPTPTTTSSPDPSTYLKASSAAGCITGSTLGLLFRGPRNVIPGAIMFTIFGYSGQHVYNFLDESHTQWVSIADERDMKQSKGEEVGYGGWGWRGFVEWLTNPKRKWSPIKKLTDREYEEMLQERLLGVEADLAMIDEEIERVRRDARERKGRGRRQS